MNKATALACTLMISIPAGASEVCDRRPKPIYPAAGVTVTVPFIAKYSVVEHGDLVIVSLVRKSGWTQTEQHHLLASDANAGVLCAGHICGIVFTDLAPGLWTWTTRIYDPVARCVGQRSAAAYFYAR